MAYLRMDQREGDKELHSKLRVLKGKRVRISRPALSLARVPYLGCIGVVDCYRFHTPWCVHVEGTTRFGEDFAVWIALDEVELLD